MFKHVKHSPAYLMTRFSDGASPLLIRFPIAAGWAESPQLRVHGGNEEVFDRTCILSRDSWSAEARHCRRILGYNRFIGRWYAFLLT